LRNAVFRRYLIHHPLGIIPCSYFRFFALHTFVATINQIRTAVLIQVLVIIQTFKKSEFIVDEDFISMLLIKLLSSIKQSTSLPVLSRQK